MADEDVTLGELSRRLDSFREHVDGRFTDIHKRLDRMNFVPREVHDVQIEQLKTKDSEIAKEVDELEKLVEEWKTWITRAVVGSFIFPVLLIIVTAWVGSRT